MIDSKKEWPNSQLVEIEKMRAQIVMLECVVVDMKDMLRMMEEHLEAGFSNQNDNDIPFE